MFRDARVQDRQRTAASFDKALERYAAQAEAWFDGTAGSIDRRLVSCDRLLHSVRATVARLPSLTDSRRYLKAAGELDSDRRALLALRDDLLTGASGRADVVGPPGWRTAKHWYDDAAEAGHVPPSEGPHPRDYPSREEYQDARNMHHWINRSRDLAEEHSPARPGEFNHAQGDYEVGDPAKASSGGRGYRPPPSEEIHPAPPRTIQHGALEGVDRRWVELESARFVAANTDALDDSHELATRAHNYAAMKTSTFTPQRSAALCEGFVARVTSLGRASYRPRVASVEQFVEVDPQAMYLC